MTDRTELLGNVELGIEAEAFLGSHVGKYLTERAESELAEALDGLKKVSPTDVKGITELQNKVWRAESVQTWLAEVIQTGWNAEEMLRQDE